MTDNQPKHTPGPWNIDARMDGGKHGDDFTIFAETRVHKNPVFLARVYNAGILAPNDPEREANARLIAAAPGLLTTLEDVELRCTQARLASAIGKKSGQKQADFLRGALEEIATVARAAITKAAGKE